jgi:hypothetical protein
MSGIKKEGKMKKKIGFVLLCCSFYPQNSFGDGRFDSNACEKLSEIIFLVASGGGDMNSLPKDASCDEVKERVDKLLEILDQIVQAGELSDSCNFKRMDRVNGNLAEIHQKLTKIFLVTKGLYERLCVKKKSAR